MSILITICILIRVNCPDVSINDWSMKDFLDFKRWFYNLVQKDKRILLY